MGKLRGFMEYNRLNESVVSPKNRIKNYKEFTLDHDEKELQKQGGRCMDCGVPFCHSGCPLGNLIPDFNDAVYENKWEKALNILHSTNNFPEFTGRLCPAPCEDSCVLGIVNPPVSIELIEKYIVERGFKEKWIVPKPPLERTGKKVAIIGSGPAGLAAAQQLNSSGHNITVFERDNKIGGLLRYGIPDFKLGKNIIDRRVNILTEEGIKFKCNIEIGKELKIQDLEDEFDAILLATGSTIKRNLEIPGNKLSGVIQAMDFLTHNNQYVDGQLKKHSEKFNAKGKKVIVIGGGDTGSDCIGTSNRHGAASVTQFELMPQPPEQENKSMIWPYWPLKMRTSSSHEEGCERDWSIATKSFEGENGKVKQLIGTKVEWRDGKMQEVSNTEFKLKADLVLLAMGFMGPKQTILEKFSVEKDQRGNAKALTEGEKAYFTSRPKVFAAGDMRRGQSLVVWAIREGRQCARSVDEYLMGTSVLPR